MCQEALDVHGQIVKPSSHEGYDPTLLMAADLDIAMSCGEIEYSLMKWNGELKQLLVCLTTTTLRQSSVD